MMAAEPMPEIFREERLRAASEELGQTVSLLDYLGSLALLDLSMLQVLDHLRDCGGKTGFVLDSVLRAWVGEPADSGWALPVTSRVQLSTVLADLPSPVRLPALSNFGSGREWILVPLTFAGELHGYFVMLADAPNSNRVAGVEVELIVAQYAANLCLVALTREGLQELRA